MNQLRKKPFWQGKIWFLMAGFLVVIGWASQQAIVRDFWKGMGYRPSAEMQEIRTDLELTGRGEQIFAASWPMIESSVEFNEHCNSYDVDVSLLGCYTNGKIYVYEIELEELETGNIVTTAHELLHAAWERMGKTERQEVSEWLEEIYEERREWFDKELEVYQEGERLEEMYTRAGTKLRNLPEVAEKHYGKFFANREKIVAYYERYETPFLELKTEMEELMTVIEQSRAEIEAGRDEYLSMAEVLEKKIDVFNQCADTAGCFTSAAEFTRQRQGLMKEKDGLEELRERVNTQIKENNERIDKYRELQSGLGRLNDAVNSNIELIEETK